MNTKVIVEKLFDEITANGYTPLYGYVAGRTAFAFSVETTPNTYGASAYVASCKITEEMEYTSHFPEDK